MTASHPEMPLSHTGSEERRSKRRRIALACDSCRTRKTKCDGGRPSCNVCLDMEFVCNYTRRPLRASVVEATEHQESVPDLKCRLDAMESVLQSVLTGITSKERGEGQVGSPTWQCRQGNTKSSGVTDSSTTPLSFDAATRKNYTNANHSPEITTAQEDTVDGMGLVTFAHEDVSTFFGPTSNSVFLRHIKKAILGYSSEVPTCRQDRHGLVNVSDVSRPSSPRLQSRWYSESNFPPQLPRNAYDLPPRWKIIGLVNAFFDRPGMLFPYTYKKCILDGLEHGKDASLHSVRRSWLCLLNTIMAFSTILGDSSRNSIETSFTEADAFLQRALKLLPDLAVETANFETLQALLLMTQCVQGSRRSSQTWYLQRLAVQAAFQIGIHAPSQPGEYSPLVRELRRRAWFMCFILDKTCSMTFGRPPTIPNSYVTQDLPLDVDLEDLDFGISDVQNLNTERPLQPRSTAILYIQSIKLYQIIGDIIESIYQNNIGADSGLSDSELLKRILSVEQAMNTWRAQLPAELRVKSKDEIMKCLNASSIFSHLSTVLTLRYLMARLLLHRPVVSRFLDCKNEQGCFENSEFLELFGGPNLKLALRSASEMIDIIFSLSEHQHLMLTTWWFSIYYIFSASLIIFSAMILKHQHSTLLFCHENLELSSALLKAVKALERTGDGTRMVARCLKHLRKLAEFAETFGLENCPCEVSASQENEAGLALPMQFPDLLDFPGMDIDDGLCMHDGPWNGSFF